MTRRLKGNLRRPGATLLPAVTGALASFAAPTMGRAATPMSYLNTYGQPGNDIQSLTWGLIILAVSVVVIISLLVIVGIWLRPKVRDFKAGEQLPVVRAGGVAGVRWMYGGLAVTTIALAVFVTWTMITMAAIDRPATDPGLTIEVTGHQWWWEVNYVDAADPGRNFETANEIHIPVGRPVRFKLASADVIHSFWVPSLAGKTDLIPGQINIAWLQADKPGVYRGQCAEFCGQQHAHMAMRLFADPPEDFDRWWDNQLTSAAEPQTDLAASGLQQFTLRCGACHTVRGTNAGGQMGPDLSHLMTRTSLAAVLLANDTAHLSAWISDPQHLKPGTKMPNIELSGEELTAIRTFLSTLD